MGVQFNPFDGKLQLISGSGGGGNPSFDIVTANIYQGYDGANADSEYGPATGGTGGKIYLDGGNANSDSSGAWNGGNSGSIDLRGYSAGADYAGNGGSIIMKGGNSGANAGSIDTSGDFAFNGGSITTRGGAGYQGGSINTNGGNYGAGGSIDTGAYNGIGGSINTSNDGGNISTFGQGNQFNGGYIATFSNNNLGGYINTSDGGGSIDTAQGFITLGISASGSTKLQNTAGSGEEIQINIPSYLTGDSIIPSLQLFIGTFLYDTLPNYANWPVGTRAIITDSPLTALGSLVNVSLPAGTYTYPVFLAPDGWRVG